MMVYILLTAILQKVTTSFGLLLTPLSHGSIDRTFIARRRTAPRVRDLERQVSSQCTAHNIASQVQRRNSAPILSSA